MKRGTVLWVLAALAGIAVTAGVTWAASQLVSQRIGLSSEPLSIARGLAPPVTATKAAPARRAPVRRHRRPGASASGSPAPVVVTQVVAPPPPTQTVTAPAPPPPPPATPSTAAATGGRQASGDGRASGSDSRPRGRDD